MIRNIMGWIDISLICDVFSIYLFHFYANDLWCLNWLKASWDVVILKSWTNWITDVSKHDFTIRLKLCDSINELKTNDLRPQILIVTVFDKFCSNLEMETHKLQTLYSSSC